MIRCAAKKGAFFLKKMASKRTELLKELLGRINTYGAWPELRLEDYAEFGPAGAASEEYPEDERRSDAIFGLIGELSAAIDARTRTTLWTDSVLADAAKYGARIREHLSAMTEPARTGLIESLRRVAKSHPDSMAALIVGKQPVDPTAVENHPDIEGHRETSTSESVTEQEQLDRHYSAEVIEKLELIIQRASQLSAVPLSMEQQFGGDLQRYFTEAHQCYLYGFPAACAVLCRAILESALKLKLPGKFDDLDDRIETAHAQGLLSQERRVWAYEVKEAGNHAIHNYERFSKGDLSSKVEEYLLKTRAIVEEILAVRKA